MKEPFRFYLFAAAVMLTVPAAAVLTLPKPSRSGLISDMPLLSQKPLQADAGYKPADTYRVLLTDRGEIAEVPVRDYLIGAVAAEMPASYEAEALRAQAVVSHTYAEPGDYTITMTASDGVSTTSFASPAPIAVRPEVLYVSSGNAAAAAPRAAGVTVAVKGARPAADATVNEAASPVLEYS